MEKARICKLLLKAILFWGPNLWLENKKIKKKENKSLYHKNYVEDMQTDSPEHMLLTQFW